MFLGGIEVEHWLKMDLNTCWGTLFLLFAQEAT